MSSEFESEVYINQNKVPWTNPHFLAFANDMIENLDYLKDPSEGEVVLRIRYRHDVLNRRWFTLEWTGADGQRQSEEAQTYNKLLWRAVTREKQIEDKLERTEKKDVPAQQSPEGSPKNSD